MKNIILIAGYTKLAHIEIIRQYFIDEDITLACAYTRRPITESKNKYLEAFDVLFDLEQPGDVDKLQHVAHEVRLITCTQERDMEVYIQSQLLCGKISPTQAKKYTQVLDKYTFKTELKKINPELVPRVQIVDTELLQNLDSLSYPQVIKPSGLAGSILVTNVTSPEDFKNHYDTFSDAMRKIATKNYEKEIEVITEEYISGPQYSVNVYIDAEQNITFCPISRVITPQEMGEDDSYSALQYTTSELSDDNLAKLKDAVRAVVKHFEIKSTSAHFDSVLHSSGWKFFEVGLRIGGNRQEIYQLSHTMNHFRNDIRNRLGQEVRIPQQQNAVCIIQKASQEKGILTDITYTRTIAKEKPPLIMEGKMAKVGSKVMPLSKGGGTIARFLLWGKDEKEVIADSKSLFHSIQFNIK